MHWRFLRNNYTWKLITALFYIIHYTVHYADCTVPYFTQEAGATQGGTDNERRLLFPPCHASCHNTTASSMRGISIFSFLPTMSSCSLLLLLLAAASLCHSLTDDYDRRAGSRLRWSSGGGRRRTGVALQQEDDHDKEELNSKREREKKSEDLFIYLSTAQHTILLHSRLLFSFNLSGNNI